MDYVGSGASISGCGTYRYQLWREWRGHGSSATWMKDEGKPAWPKHITFVMLNPSTADGKTDDPTIRRCVGFAKSLGYDKMMVVNLFAYRATDPKKLLALNHNDDLIGVENQRHFDLTCNTSDCAMVIAGWGAHGGHLGQDENALGWIYDESKIHALGLTKDGHPRHPLYLRSDSEPFHFSGQVHTPKAARLNPNGDT